MDSVRLRQLSEQYLQDTLNPAEWDEFRSWLVQEGDHAPFKAVMTQALEQGEYEPVDGEVLERILQRIRVMEAGEAAPVEIQAPVRTMPAGRRFLYRWGWAAACILVLLGAGLFWVYHSRSITDSGPGRPVLAKLVPGSDKALLTLGDGKTVALDSTGRQVISQGAMAVRQEGGELRYERESGGVTEQKISFNTLLVPRGGQFRVVLADGTNVWLNAASSIRYPTAFTGPERLVEITGEAYFEVARQPGKPFRVKLNDSSVVEVLGTYFNINAYAEESLVRTTLLEGAVRVEGGGGQVVLRPGQEARIGRVEGNSGKGRLGQADGLQVVRLEDPERVVAWKNGEFQFGEKADIGSIMRQLARWYDVDIEYQGTIQFHFGGSISRRLTLDKALEKLEMTGNVHFRMEGRKIIVLP